MKRLPVLAAALGVLALAGGFAAYVAVGSGAPAFTVNGHTVSQSDVDSELHGPHRQRRVREGDQAVGQPGALDAARLDRLQLHGRLADAAHRADPRRRHDHPAPPRGDDGADRSQADGLAVSLLGSEAVLRTLPSSFRADLQARFARIVAVRDDELTRHTAQLHAAALATCPSHRFVAHILVSSQAEAVAIAGQLAAGADFATLARQHSIDGGSAVQGGELGCLDNQQFVTGFEQVAQTQPVGQVSAPVQTQFGFHLILVRDQPQTADLESLALRRRARPRPRRAGRRSTRAYGTWDRRNGRVVPPSASSRGAAPAPSG